MWRRLAGAGFRGIQCGCGLLLLMSVTLPVAGVEVAGESPACANGVELRLSSQEAQQGSLLLVEIRSALPLAQLEAHWQGQRLRFWPAGNPEGVQRALLGIDLAQPAGRFPLTLSADGASGERLTCSVWLSVEEAKFATERLRVDRRFVELTPEDLERARREGERLRALWQEVTPERLWQGAFRLPLEGIESAGNFGRRRWLNQQPRSPHGGEDFSAPAGTPVRATERGRVVLAEALLFSGNTVVLDHGLGLYTFYGHLESIGVKEGELVEAGAVVGRVGATGRVTGAHLHWAVRLNATRVNPLDLVAVLAD